MPGTGLPLARDNRVEGGEAIRPRCDADLNLDKAVRVHLNLLHLVPVAVVGLERPAGLLTGGTGYFGSAAGLRTHGHEVTTAT